MKKFISFMLATIICFSSVIPAFAEIQKSNIDNTITIYRKSDGLWSESSSNNIRSGTIEIKADEQFATIYTSDTNDYFKKIDDSNYMPVDKVEINLNDKNIAEKVTNYDMPQEVLNGIVEMVALAEKNHCDNAKLALFVPDSTLRAGNFLPKVTTTWNNKTFHTYEVFFTEMWTTPQLVSSGNATSRAVLNTIKELIVGIAGTNDVIGVASALYNIGQSCLAAWKEITNTNNDPIFGNSENKVFVNVCYNIYLKYTYYYDKQLNIEYPGCSSQRVYVRQIDTDTYLYSSTGGKRALKTVYPNKAYETPNYSDPEETAYYYHHAVWTERAEAKVEYKDVNGNNKTKQIDFTWPNFTWPSNWPN